MAIYDIINVSGFASTPGEAVFILEDLGLGHYQLLGSTTSASGLGLFGISGGAFTFTTILPDGNYTFTNADTGNAGDIFAADAVGGLFGGVTGSATGNDTTWVIGNHDT